MAATLSRVVIGADGELSMIVHPDSDWQLSNVPQFSPAGSTWADVQRGTLSVQIGDRPFWTAIQPIIAAKRQILGDLITQRVALIDAISQFRDDKDTYDTRVAQWPSPTGPQQLLINAALAKVAQDIQDIQTIRDNIAAIKAQLG